MYFWPYGALFWFGRVIFFVFMFLKSLSVSSGAASVKKNKNWKNHSSKSCLFDFFSKSRCSLIVFHYRVLVGLKKSPPGGPKISGPPGAGSRGEVAVLHIFTMKSQLHASHMPGGSRLVPGWSRTGFRPPEFTLPNRPKNLCAPHKPQQLLLKSDHISGEVSQVYFFCNTSKEILSVFGENASGCSEGPLFNPQLRGLKASASLQPQAFCPKNDNIPQEVLQKK